MLKDLVRRAAFGLLLSLGLSGGAALAGEIVLVRLELLSEPSLVLRVGETLESPIRVRVLRASDNQPLEGVQVNFIVDQEVCVPLDPDCVEPDPGLEGSFVDMPGGAPIPGVSLSDAEGVAVSPDFAAGSVAGSYLITPLVATVLSGQNFSQMGSPSPRVQLTQLGQFAAAPNIVPVAGTFGLGVLVVLIVLGAAVLLRTASVTRA